ncbi:hypothetical protein PIB30_083539 [Stylosanthes scabra]|uniref:Uncharacterized protein n=1 Tax=Stylosanthes scabra TaxID=79078 RepID=A0ABU6QSC1_9FABA|nr:hypothetical protein [Stylosanthes scabra]
MGRMKQFNASCVQVKFRAEVAKESARNEKIAKKSLKAKSRGYAYAPKEPMRTHCHALGIMSSLEPDHMRKMKKGSLRSKKEGNWCILPEPPRLGVETHA